MKPVGFGQNRGKGGLVRFVRLVTFNFLWGGAALYRFNRINIYKIIENWSNEDIKKITVCL